MFYALLGRLAWSIVKRVLKRRFGGAATGRLPLVAGVGLAAGGALFARARRARTA